MGGPGITGSGRKMTEFSIYLQLGIEHITDLEGYDHIVFLLALVAGFGLSDWKRVVLLVTAFTVGHTLTLVLAALDIFPVHRELIEFLIPLTILITALANLSEGGSLKNIRWKYGMALGFGLIHGLGFSSFFKSLLGTSSDITLPLFGFNLGVELGQVGIVLVALIFTEMIVGRLKWLNRRDWTVFLSGIAAGIAVLLMQKAAFWI